MADCRSFLQREGDAAELGPEQPEIAQERKKQPDLESRLQTATGKAPVIITGERAESGEQISSEQRVVSREEKKEESSGAKAAKRRHSSGRCKGGETGGRHEGRHHRRHEERVPEVVQLLHHHERRDAPASHHTELHSGCQLQPCSRCCQDEGAAGGTGR